MLRPCVLVIDDDPVFARIVEKTLKPCGYAVVVAADLMSARVLLESSGAQRFACILLDHQLPDGDGEEVLRWLTARDSPLAAVMISASGERNLLRQTMVDGACDFLSKPVDPAELIRATAAGAATTARRRALAELRDQVQTAAENQERLLAAMLHSGVFVEHKFCPKHECGGDFLVHHRFPNADEVFILSDVAGHDLAASVQSSFFHGWTTGILSHSGNVAQALRAYNRLLLEQPVNLIGSIAVTALEIHPEAGCVVCYNCGGPPPFFVDWWGWARSIGENSSSPLGWFEHSSPTVIRTGIPPGPVWVWTDGLESLAVTLRASPLSLAYVLLQPGAPDPPWLAQANDDVLLARIWPRSTPDFEPGGYFHPLFADRYGQDDIPAIDALQNRWRTSLRIALPQLPSNTLHDVLLPAREALLNALQHGCAKCDHAEFQILYHPQDRLLRVRVADPGAGHDFNWIAHSAEEPSGQSCGLLLIYSLASRILSERNGAELTLDYFLSPDFAILRAGSESKISTSGRSPCLPTL